MSTAIFYEAAVAPFGRNSEAPPIKQAKHVLTPDGRIIEKECLDCANGQIFHAAIGGQVEKFSSRASFGRNQADAPLPTDANYWSAYSFGAAVGTYAADVDARHIILRKRFGINKLILKGRAKQEITSGGINANTNHTSTIILTVNPDSSASVSNSKIITGSSYSDFIQELDISGIADDDRMTITVTVKSVTEIIDNPDSNTVETEAFLSENLSIDQVT